MNARAHSFGIGIREDGSFATLDGELHADLEDAIAHSKRIGPPFTYLDSLLHADDIYTHNVLEERRQLQRLEWQERMKHNKQKWGRQ